MLDAFNHNVLTHMYKGVMFLKSNGHFIRCTIAIDDWIRAEWKHISADQPPEAPGEIAVWQDAWLPMSRALFTKVNNT